MNTNGEAAHRRFIQFTATQRCPVCKGVHQMDLTPAFAVTWNAEGVCRVMGRRVRLMTYPGKLHTDTSRVGLAVAAKREAQVLQAVGVTP